jgi:hypothetical protein
MYPDCWPWISLARRIPGQLTDEESSSLFRLARARTPAEDPVIVVAGEASEASSLMLAGGLSDKTQPRLLLPEQPSRALDRALRLFVIERIVHHANGWDGPIDLLFTTANGLAQWLPRVKARGVVIIRGGIEDLRSPGLEDLRTVGGLSWATRQCAMDPEPVTEFSSARQQDYIRRAAREIAEDRHAVRALKNSWSWKLTAPLRWAIETAQASIGLFENPSRIARWRRFAGELESSGLFDERYYRDNHAPTPWARVNPLLHYLLCGADQGANPNELFDAAYYAARYPEVAASGLPPAIHYLRHGAYAGLDPHPYFDSSFYLEQHPDVPESGLNPLAHYLAPGIAEGRDPNPWFDTSEYLEQNSDVATFALNPLTHQTEFWSKRAECSR